MRRILATLAVVGALLFSAGAAWADFDDGVAALKRGDYATALQEFRLLAEQGHAEAQNNVGVMFGNGLGVSQDHAEAAKWYRKAAEQGHVEAQKNLGGMYFKGVGVSQNHAEAAKWYRKAAEQGHAGAQNNLGFMYSNGLGVSKNEAEATKWFRKAAEQGFAEAQKNLGFMYFNGKGISKNEAEAVKWYRKAAEQGHVQAQFNLGFIYANGLGVPQEFVKAYMWWSLASAQGHQDGALSLDQIKPHMTPTQIAKAQALATDWRQANSQQGSKREEQNVDLEAERKVLNEKLTKIIMKTINWTPLEVTEGTLNNPGPPISQTCPPDVAQRIQEVSEEEFTKLLEQISGDLASGISSRITKKLNLSEARLAVDTLEEFSSWPEEDQKAFQETDLAKRIQQLVLPEITQSLKTVGQKFSQLAPGIFEKIEVRLETEGIIKVSEHNWCLQD